MKKHFLFIAGLIILLFNSKGIAQHFAPTQAEMKRFTHNMTADSADRWAYTGFRTFDEKTRTFDEKTPVTPKFDVWIKPFWIDRFNNEIASGVNGHTLTADLYYATELELATTSITPANADKYQYRVMSDTNELVPWTTPSVFRSNKFTSYAYFGKFNCDHTNIALFIAEKDNRNNRTVYNYNSFTIPVVALNYLVIQYPTGLSVKNSRYWTKDGVSISLGINPESITLHIKNTLRNELYHVYLKRETHEKDSIIPVGNNWEHTFNEDGPELHISGSLFSKPGKYTIIIRPEITGGHKQPIIIGKEAMAHFTILPGPITIPLKTVEFIIVILLTTGGFMFMMYRRQQKQKLAREAQNKRIATLQLQSVRAQLNPHFIFNALAGIQNLINKNAIEDANKYLTRFARLTRNVLDEGHKDLISIEQEISLLDDYLQMEQTRFGFKFSIDVNADVDQQIEIPAMLLQPFVENAVKHGISALKNEGLIIVSIAKNNTDIILTVQDNGKGFNPQQTGGMGIQLCRDRIALFNSIYKNTAILLHIKPERNGTLITIELKNWL